MSNLKAPNWVINVCCNVQEINILVIHTSFKDCLCFQSLHIHYILYVYYVLSLIHLSNVALLNHQRLQKPIYSYSRTAQKPIHTFTVWSRLCKLPCWLLDLWIAYQTHLYISGETAIQKKKRFWSDLLTLCKSINTDTVSLFA